MMIYILSFTNVTVFRTVGREPLAIFKKENGGN